MDKRSGFPELSAIPASENRGSPVTSGSHGAALKSNFYDLERECLREVPTTGVAHFVEELSQHFKVSYTPTAMDDWAQVVTSLAGNEVLSGRVQDLLVALKRAGKLSTGEMATLLVNYLREQR
ncbi:hypothetical protein [Bordetella genomosp. 10]|uniref:hypothetical protein n=1 Tax=Bordetella genomosp. 10 TaxID=1416804 RepID=UPI0011783485|nr:hypothetical protein [Bordetella genomosp. 10]